jgi:O-antigen/teichoic acid export membrane protein
MTAATGSQARIARRTIATWVTLIATVTCVFAARALIARRLGPEGIGLYALMLTAAWLAGTLLSVGLPAYNASFAARVPAGVLLSNSIAWNAAAAAALCSVGVPVLAVAAIPLTWKVMIVGVLMSPLMSLLECTRGIFQGLSAMSPYNWLGLSSGALNLGGVGLLLATSRLTLWSAIACWIFATLISAVAAVRLGGRQAGGLQRVDRQVLGASLRFGGQAWLSQLTGIVNFRIALLLTQWLLGTVAVGLFAIAVTIAEVLFYFPNALAIVSSARYAAASRADARALLRRSARWVLAVSGATAIGLAIVARPVIRLGFGASYNESATVLQIILPGVVAYTPIAVVTWYFNAHRQRPIVNLIIAGFSAILNASLTLLWAPRHGLAGVAWATTTAYVAASLFSIVMVRRESGPAS